MPEQLPSKKCTLAVVLRADICHTVERRCRMGTIFVAHAKTISATTEFALPKMAVDAGLLATPT